MVRDHMVCFLCVVDTVGRKYNVDDCEGSVNWSTKVRIKIDKHNDSVFDLCTGDNTLKIIAGILFTTISLYTQSMIMTINW